MKISATMINRFPTKSKVFYAGRLMTGSKEVCDFYLDTDGKYYASNIINEETFIDIFEGNHELFDKAVKSLVKSFLNKKDERTYMEDGRLVVLSIVA